MTKVRLLNAADDLKAAMRKTYDACSSGVDAPKALVVNGTILNGVLGVEEYDPHEAYYVMGGEISRVEHDVES